MCIHCVLIADGIFDVNIINPCRFSVDLKINVMRVGKEKMVHCTSGVTGMPTSLVIQMTVDSEGNYNLFFVDKIWVDKVPTL